MDDGWVVAVQIDQAAQNLPRPALDHLLINVLVALAVPAGEKGEEETRQARWEAGQDPAQQQGTGMGHQQPGTAAGQPVQTSSPGYARSGSLAVADSTVLRVP